MSLQVGFKRLPTKAFHMASSIKPFIGHVLNNMKVGFNTACISTDPVIAVVP